MDRSICLIAWQIWTVVESLGVMVKTTLEHYNSHPKHTHLLPAYETLNAPTLAGGNGCFFL